MQEIGAEVFSESKWNILKELAHSKQSPSDLASSTKTSISNITQQLKLLEAYNIVRKERDAIKGAGKRRTIYSIDSEFVQLVVLRNGLAEKKTFKIDASNNMIFNALIAMNPDDLFYLLKFNIKYEEVLKKCKAIGFLKSSKDSLELFLLTDHVDEIRAKFSNLFIEDANSRTKKIINWTHNEFEVNDGLLRKDKYFMDMLKNVQVIYDPSGILLAEKKQRSRITI